MSWWCCQMQDREQPGGKEERRGLLVSSRFWSLSYQFWAGDDTVALGAGNPVLRLLGVLWLSLSPCVVCPVEHYPCSWELRMRTVACTPAIWGDPAQPLAVFEERRLLAQFACPQGGMKAELCSPGITLGKQSLQLTLVPQPSRTGASKLEMVPWK